VLERGVDHDDDLGRRVLFGIGATASSSWASWAGSPLVARFDGLDDDVMLFRHIA